MRNDSAPLARVIRSVRRRHFLEERRKLVRRQSDRLLLQKVRDLEGIADRRREFHDDAARARRRTIRHSCAVAISVSMGYSSGYADTWTVDSVKIPGRILDLSKGGALLFTKQRIETGQELGLAIKLRGGAIINSKSVVRWVKDMPEKGGFALGVQLSGVSEKDRSKIAKFLAELDATMGL